MSELRTDRAGRQINRGWGLGHIYAEGYPTHEMFCGALHGGLQFSNGYCQKHGRVPAKAQQ